MELYYIRLMKIIIKNDEKWKNIKGYDGKYQISNKGRVKNTENNKILNQPKAVNGVPLVNFRYNNKSKSYQIKTLVVKENKNSIWL